jgi:hypothetical protein
MNHPSLLVLDFRLTQRFNVQVHAMGTRRPWLGDKSPEKGLTDAKASLMPMPKNKAVSQRSQLGMPNR